MWITFDWLFFVDMRNNSMHEAWLNVLNEFVCDSIEMPSMHIHPRVSSESIRESFVSIIYDRFYLWPHQQTRWHVHIHTYIHGLKNLLRLLLVWRGTFVRTVWLLVSAFFSFSISVWCFIKRILLQHTGIGVLAHQISRTSMLWKLIWLNWSL